MSKRRNGFPSETQVKRGDRTVRAGEVELLERLGKTTHAHADPGGAFKNCCRNSGRF